MGERFRTTVRRRGVSGFVRPESWSVCGLLQCGAANRGRSRLSRRLSERSSDQPNIRASQCADYNASLRRLESRRQPGLAAPQAEYRHE